MAEIVASRTIKTNNAGTTEPDELDELNKRMRATIRPVKKGSKKKGPKKELDIIVHGDPKFFEEIEDRLLKHYDLTIETDDRPPPWQPQKTKPHGQGPKGLRTDKIKARIRSVMKIKK